MFCRARRGTSGREEVGVAWRGCASCRRGVWTQESGQHSVQRLAQIHDGGFRNGHASTWQHGWLSGYSASRATIGCTHQRLRPPIHSPSGVTIRMESIPRVFQWPNVCPRSFSNELRAMRPTFGGG